MKINVNGNYQKLTENYLFSDIAKRVAAYQAANPDKKVIRLGIGDVTLPLPKTVVEAMDKAVQEMGVKETFRGYPPEYGYDFVREAIAKHYANFGVEIAADDIFLSDGAKSDCGNIVDILGDNQIYMPDPVYPVYMDSNIMSGRAVRLMPSTKENGFLPMPQDDYGCGVYYICSPNNPTGAVYSLEQLQQWVDFALKSGSLIIFDSAYEAFIADETIPHSIYAAKGAKECAIEICSFSKTAGFTGVRCGYTVIPKELMAGETSLRKLWMRRQATKFNGVSYPVQRAAQYAYSEAGMQACLENIAYYMENARILAEVFTEKGIFFTGGIHSPYIWLQCPNGMKSWEFFDYLLENIQVVGTPGAGFGSCGEGYFRLTAFGSREATLEAAERLKELL